MDRLTFSPAFRDRVLLLVERHDDVFDATPKAVKRALARMGGNDGAVPRALRFEARGCQRTRLPAMPKRGCGWPTIWCAFWTGSLEADEAFTLKAWP